MYHEIAQKKPFIHLDHAAATPLSETARAAMDAMHEYTYGNPSSIHEVGRQAFDALHSAKTALANVLDVTSDELVLTGSGTESANLALFGIARAYRALGAHIIVSSIEHKAVLAAAKELECEGCSVTYLPVDSFGTVSLEALRSALRPDTILVSVMYANNEIGTIEPIRDIAKIVRGYRNSRPFPFLHTDACQAAGMLPICPTDLGVDAFTLNSSKTYGPKGIGLLYVKKGVSLKPLIVGGGQEHGRRAGTENIALAAGFAAALEEAHSMRKAHVERLWELHRHFTRALRTLVPGIQCNGHPDARLPNNVHVTVPDIEGESAVLMLSEAGITAATGSACSSHTLEPSHVLLAIGQNMDHIHGSIRFTFGRETTHDDLSYAAHAFSHIVRHLRSITASTTAVYMNQKN